MCKVPELVGVKVFTNTPVLKHGLGSLSHVRVFGWMAAGGKKLTGVSMEFEHA